jgi:hypothetical protein
VAQIVAKRNLRSARSADGWRAALSAQIAGLQPDNLRHGGGRRAEFFMSFSAPEANTSVSLLVAGHFSKLTVASAENRR